MSGQRGASLVEILAALAVQAAVLVALVELYGTGGALLRGVAAVSDLQDDGAYAALLLERDLRSAGYAGCRHVAERRPRVIAEDFAEWDSVDDGVELWEGGSGFTAPPGYEAAAGSDVVRVRYATGGAQLAGNLEAENANLQVVGETAGFEAGNVLLVTDCDAADVFRATAVSRGNGRTTIAHGADVNSSNRLSKRYREHARVFRLEEITYFVGRGGGEAGLFRAAGDGAPVLVSGAVERLEVAEVRNGEDEPVGYRYELLLASADGLTTAAQGYSLAGQAVADPGDRRLRRVYRGFASLRNNLP
ncbi:MAG: hypothetical protein KatS3mg124_1687 [Porticoccaceae bacterium]|nr:MAG: hypothetical protein KatS3mg124_1687 [Porticoccaceae bacterium]